MWIFLLVFGIVGMLTGIVGLVESFYCDSDDELKVSMLILTLGFILTCGGILMPDSSEQAEQVEQQSVTQITKKENQKDKQLAYIDDNLEVKDLYNGFHNQVIGKYSVLKISSTAFDQQMMEKWYFNYAKNKVSSHEWNFAVVAYTDKPGYGTFYNSLLTRDCKIKKDEYGDYSMGADGQIYVEDENNSGHLKKL